MGLTRSLRYQRRRFVKPWQINNPNQTINEMDEYSKTLYEEEYTNDEDWMNAAVHSGIIDQESKEGLLWHIHQVIKRGHWYKPSDMRIEEDGTIRIPRTLQSLHGYMAQWDHDKELIKAGGEWYKRGNFSRDEIPEEMRNKENIYLKQLQGEKISGRR